MIACIIIRHIHTGFYEASIDIKGAHLYGQGDSPKVAIRNLEDLLKTDDELIWHEPGEAHP